MVQDLHEQLREKDQLIESLRTMIEDDTSDGSDRVLQMEQQISNLQQDNLRLSQLAETNRECSICMEDKETTEFKILNPCGHRFCQTCISSFENQCPCCRTPFTGTVPYYPANEE